jgi:tetratricopeptide (TPR) repeat protein
MPVKDQLITMLDEAKQAVQQLYPRLTKAERETPGAIDHWATKDVITHITFWNERLADEFEGMTFPHVDDVDKANAEIFQAHAADAWEEVMKASDRTFDRLKQHIQSFSEEDLLDSTRFPWSRKNIPWRMIAGNAYTHVLLHLSQNYAERGDSQTGEQIQKASLEKLLALDSSDQWRGTNLYNLACFYATTGQKEQALELLAESLRLNPGLTEWSKEDTDLISLHSEAAYQALLYPQIQRENA